MAKPKIGDIIEIPTSMGLAYAIYTHEHEQPPKFGALLRVFDRLYPSRPDSLENVISDRVRFSTFFPLTAAIRQGIFEVVGNVSVPIELLEFPIFRDGIADPKTKKVKVWWLWDGEKETRVGNLTQEQRFYPIRAIWNDTMLVHRIESNWRPEDEV